MAAPKPGAAVQRLVVGRGPSPACGEATPERYLYGMAVRVECYAGYRGDQEPLAFWLGKRRLAVRAVVDRWFAPTQR